MLLPSARKAFASLPNPPAIAQVTRGPFSAMQTCEGWAISTKRRCGIRSGLVGGRCRYHQNQCRGFTKGNEKCFALILEGTKEYCCTLHDPRYKLKLVVSPDELRKDIGIEMRQEVVAKWGENDGYTKKPIRGEKHLGHVSELQMNAECLNRTWELFKDSKGGDKLLDAVTFVRDELANELANLKFTSADMNLIKGKACTQMIEDQREGDTTKTFTDYMLAATPIDGRKIGRETTRTIRKAIQASLKHSARETDSKSDNDPVLEALSEQYQKMRIDMGR